MNKTAQKTERINMVISPQEIDQIEDWRGHQRPVPSKSEAIRRLVQIGLMADKRKAENTP